MKQLCTSAIALLLLLSPSSAPAEAVDDVALGNTALRVGDLESAHAAFTRLKKRPRTRQDGTAGLLAVALARADEQALLGLLKGLAPERSNEALILAAGAAELFLAQGTLEALRWADAACGIEGAAWPDEVRGLCTMAPLLRATKQRSKCAAGCDGALVLPFSYAGSQPVVLASINGSAPLPFLVDTGASNSLLTEDAAQSLGLVRREDTALQINATGGMIPSWRDLVTMQLGEARIEDVSVVIADLPIAGLAGILSPQPAWPDHVIEMDFTRHELRVAPASGQELTGVLLPYRQHEERPYLELRSADRPPWPMVIDTGASHTQIDEAWERLGALLERREIRYVEGAGGARTIVVPTTGLLQATAGPLSLPLRDPTVYSPHHSDMPGVQNHGLLGADTWMGRTLSIDRSGKRLAMTDPISLAPWKTGDAASFSVSLEGVPAGRFTERVVARDDDTVTLEVTIDEHSSFTVRTPDTWTSRGSWMLTRQADEAWTHDETGEVPLDQGAVVAKWLPLFRSFGTVQSHDPPGLRFGPHRVGAAELSCTRLELAAESKGEAATFSMLECPALPWRVVELRLVRKSDGLVLWEVLRDPEEPGSPPAVGQGQ